MIKTWCMALLLALPVLARGETPREEGPPDSLDGWQADAPADPNEAEISWVDSSHSYATERAQALTEWMDNYFGEPNYELESAESLIRIDFTSDWDEEDGTNNNVRLRGKLQLPKISKRLNIVFSDESGDELDPGEEQRKLDDNFGLLYRVAEDKHSRFDLTMGITWNRVRPGVRYRYQGALSDITTYRFTQRLQYDNSDGGYATSQIELNRVLGEDTVLRWNNRAIYGEETDGTEWISRLSLFERRADTRQRRELGINYFGAVNGVTSPDSYVKNYRLGILFRRQIYRRYLFFEVEPAYNYRKRDPDEKRQFAWSIALRFQIALERDLDRNRRKNNKNKAEPEMETETETEGDYSPTEEQAENPLPAD